VARILLIDENANDRRNRGRLLRNGGHEVLAAEGDTLGRLHDDCRKIIGEVRGKFDFIVLDISFRMNAFDGVHLYNKLVEGGLRNGWKHTIILSKHVSNDIGSATYDEAQDFPREYVTRIFAETAGIPFENVFQGEHGGPGPILQRIDDLVRSTPDRLCRECGQARDWM
jgi:CheY-like chemotaxis protein